MTIQNPILPHNFADKSLERHFKMPTAYNDFKLLNYMENCSCTKQSIVVLQVDSRAFFKMLCLTEIMLYHVEKTKNMFSSGELASSIHSRNKNFLYHSCFSRKTLLPSKMGGPEKLLCILVFRALKVQLERMPMEKSLKGDLIHVYVSNSHQQAQKQGL